jgi:hypothetical protein
MELKPIKPEFEITALRRHLRSKNMVPCMVLQKDEILQIMDNWWLGLWAVPIEEISVDGTVVTVKTQKDHKFNESEIVNVVGTECFNATRKTISVVDEKKFTFETDISRAWPENTGAVLRVYSTVEDDLRRIIREEICQFMNLDAQPASSNLNSTEDFQTQEKKADAKTAEPGARNESPLPTSRPTQISSQPDAATQEFANMVTTESRAGKTGRTA